MKFEQQRKKMVEEQLRARGIESEAVIEAFADLPRELFVPHSQQSLAYSDRPIPLDDEQTISQPFVVALMLEKLELDKEQKVLEIGTGSGYQTALLCKLSKHVYSIELDPDLSRGAQEKLKKLEISNCSLKVGSGFDGWSEHAPYDAIIVSAAPDHIPRQLVRELKVGGRMILPLGQEDQALVYLHKTEEGLSSEELGGVRFVRMRAE